MAFALWLVGALACPYPGDLGSDNWHEREAASERYAAAGPRAWPRLMALTLSDDLETRVRAAELIGDPGLAAERVVQYGRAVVVVFGKGTPLVGGPRLLDFFRDDEVVRKKKEFGAAAAELPPYTADFALDLFARVYSGGCVVPNQHLDVGIDRAQMAEGILYGVASSERNRLKRK